MPRVAKPITDAQAAFLAKLSPLAPYQLADKAEKATAKKLLSRSLCKIDRYDCARITPRGEKALDRHNGVAPEKKLSLREQLDAAKSAKVKLEAEVHALRDLALMLGRWICSPDVLAQQNDQTVCDAIDIHLANLGEGKAKRMKDDILRPVRAGKGESADENTDKGEDSDDSDDEDESEDEDEAISADDNDGIGDVEPVSSRTGKP